LTQNLSVSPCTLLPVPHSVEAIASLVGQLIIDAKTALADGTVEEIHVFTNVPLVAGSYQPAGKRLLPLDLTWQQSLLALRWPTNALPEVVDGAGSAIGALIRDYLFVLLYQAGAQSLASENASRLATMQRADDNIATMIEDLTRRFHRMRQASIDEELFEVISGYEALSQHRT
jgi:F-type H+-transporting ATPase subunit gamma